MGIETKLIIADSRETLARTITPDSTDQAFASGVVSSSLELHPTALEKLSWALISHSEVSAVSCLIDDSDEAEIPTEKAKVNSSEIWLRRGAGGAIVAPSAESIYLLPERLAHKQFAAKKKESTFPSQAKASFLMGARVPHEIPFEQDYPSADRRLLFILPWCRTGGADKFNLDLCRVLVERDWELSIVLSERGEQSWIKELEKLSSDIFVLHNFIYLHDQPRFLRYLICSRHPAVVLMSQCEFAYHLLPYLRHYCPEPAYVDYSHIVSPYWINFPAYAAANAKTLDLSICSSEALKSWLEKRGAERIAVCYTNVDCDHWRPRPGLQHEVRQRYGLPTEEVLVLYAARLSFDKQPLLFAQVVKELAAEGLRFAAAVVGDGELLSNLGDFIAEHRLEQHIRYLGVLSQQEMQELMPECDIFFLPSQNEGISLAIYEAMACGLAVLSGKTGGQAELVSPDCGILIDRENVPDEAAAYHDALRELVLNRDLRQALGRGARERVESHFQLTQMGERMECLLEEVLSKKSKVGQETSDAALAKRSAEQAVKFASLGLEIERLSDYVLQCVRKELAHENEIAELKKKQTAIISEAELLQQELDLLAKNFSQLCQRKESYWNKLQQEKLSLSKRGEGGGRVARDD